MNTNIFDAPFGGLMAVTMPFVVAGRSADHLAIVGEPAMGVRGRAFARSPVVELRDTAGVRVAEGEERVVITASLAVNQGGTGGGTLASFAQTRELEVTARRRNLLDIPKYTVEASSFDENIVAGSLLRVDSRIYMVKPRGGNEHLYRAEKQRVTVYLHDAMDGSPLSSQGDPICWRLWIGSRANCTRCFHWNESAEVVMHSLQHDVAHVGLGGVSSVSRTETMTNASGIIGFRGSYSITFAVELGNVVLMKTSIDASDTGAVSVRVEPVSDGASDLLPRHIDVITASLCCRPAQRIMGRFKLRYKVKTANTTNVTIAPTSAPTASPTFVFHDKDAKTVLSVCDYANTTLRRIFKHTSGSLQSHHGWGTYASGSADSFYPVGVACSALIGPDVPPEYGHLEIEFSAATDFSTPFRIGLGAILHMFDVPPVVHAVLLNGSATNTTNSSLLA